MKGVYDLAIVGSGFAGSLVGMIARRLGLSVVLLERGRHPRVVIGESSTPLSNLLLEELADRYDLPFLRPLTKWGTWQRSYPSLACGLKRGFSFFHHHLEEERSGGAAVQHDPMLIAASPHDSIADTHWYRADLDEFLVKRAQELGVDFIDEIDLFSATRDSDRWALRGSRHKGEFTVQARFLIDATGPRGFLARSLQLGELPLPGLPETSALYSHFDNVAEFAGPREGQLPQAGYPADAAALHHVFDGGWMWVLRFNNGVTSAGVAATRDTARRFDFASGKAGWHRLLATLPRIQEQFGLARERAPFTFVPRLSHRSAQIVGEGWAMLPSAAGFVDPMLSTGFPLTLLGVERLAVTFEQHWGSPRLDDELTVYAQITDDELLATARLVGALYSSMSDFPFFRSVSLLYFAAASFAETARRLGKPELASAFLLEKDPVFGPESLSILASAQRAASSTDRSAVEASIYSLIEKFDVAGLGRRPASYCYPVRADDLYASAHKLGVDRLSMERMLERSGFVTTTDL